MAKRKQTNLKKWIIFFLMAVVLLTIFGLSKNYMPQSQKSLARYQVYQNPTFNFSIEYPNNWDTRKDTQVFENGDAIAFRISGPAQKKYTELSDGAQIAVSKPFTIDADLKTWMKSYFSPQATFSKLPLNNYTLEGVEDCGYMECMRYYFTKTGNQVYGIALYADGTSAEKAAYENALIYMLKSLKLPDAANDIVSKEAAMTKVKSLPEVVDYLKRVPNGLVLINGEEANAYTVQVYEIKNSFTATFNWYKVYKTTGAVEKQF